MKSLFGLVLAMALGCAGLRAAEQEKAWFNLDFKGGTPNELVEAMREAFKKTMVEPPAINVVIPGKFGEHADARDPDAQGRCPRCV